MLFSVFHSGHSREKRLKAQNARLSTFPCPLFCGAIKFSPGQLPHFLVKISVCVGIGDKVRSSCWRSRSLWGRESSV